MKKPVLILLLAIVCTSSMAQPTKTGLYELLKKLIPDSTGYSNVGDWDAGNAKGFPVTWTDKYINMHDDTTINFYRRGTADITIKGKSFKQTDGKPVKWQVMLKGPRMGYTNFSIVSNASREWKSGWNIDSVLGKKSYSSRLLKSCTDKPVNGFYYYELKMPKEDTVYLKLSWINIAGSVAYRVDVYDAFSSYKAKLECK